MTFIDDVKVIEVLREGKLLSVVSDDVNEDIYNAVDKEDLNMED
jgi:hypothetical protein